MKILMVGDPNLIWNYKYIKNVLINSGHDVTLMYYANIKEGYNQFYSENGIHIVAAPPKIMPSVLSTRISAVLRRFHLLWSRITHRYDCIHLQYITAKSLSLAVQAKWKKATLIATPWGSDVLRVSDKELHSREKYLDRCDYITIPSDKILDAFDLTYNCRYSSKYKYFLKLGLDIFDSLENVISKYSINECKSIFGLKTDSIVIGIGYNGSRGQQHIAVLKELEKFPADIKSKIELILHISYSLPDDGYRDELLSMAEKTGCKFHLIDKYLYNEEMAKLRNATDIFIHAQVTDEYSAAVQEYLYVGTEVFNPVWIPYGELIERGIQYIEYHDFEDMYIKLLDYIASYSGRNKRTNEYKNSLVSLSSWETYIPGWRELYKLK